MVSQVFGKGSPLSHDDFNPVLLQKVHCTLSATCVPHRNDLDRAIQLSLLSAYEELSYTLPREPYKL